MSGTCLRLSQTNILKNILSDSCVEAGVSLFVRHVNVKGKLAGGKILKEMIYYQPSSQLGSEKKRGFSWQFIFVICIS